MKHTNDHHRGACDGGESHGGIPRMTQPESMRTARYLYGVDPLDGDDAWALFVASASGDVTRVKRLLSKDRRLVNAQHWYQFPIHLAVRAGHADVVQVLLERGADPGQSRFTCSSWDNLLAAAKERGYEAIHGMLVRAMEDRFRYRPEFARLLEAILSRDGSRVRSVLRRRPDLATASDALGNNAIHWSVLTRQHALLERLVETGAAIDAPRADGQTPAMLAAHAAYDYWYRNARGPNHPSMRNVWVLLGMLLARGAEYTLSLAAAVGDQEQVERLLKRNKSLARRLDSARLSPLSYAAREGYTHIVELLLGHGADPNQPEELAPQGRALFEACAGNHVSAAEVLLRHGADPNAGVDSCGCCLTIVGHHHPTSGKPLQRLLRRHGARTPPYAMTTREMAQALNTGDPVIRDEEFLGRVLQEGNGRLVALFLERDPAVVTRMQVYSGVAYPRSPVLVRKLLAHDLDSNRGDWQGKTFLHACAENGDRSVAAVFLKAGADINARDLEYKGTPLAAAVRCFGSGSANRKPDEAAGNPAERSMRMIEFLLERGAATNLPGDAPWSTPLAWARRRGLANVTRLLKSHGATG